MVVEVLGSTPDRGDGRLAGLGAGVVEEGPVRSLDLALVLDGHLGQNVARPVDHTALAQAVGEHQLHGGDEARSAVGDDE